MVRTRLSEAHKFLRPERSEGPSRMETTNIQENFRVFIINVLIWFGFQLASVARLWIGINWRA